MVVYSLELCAGVGMLGEGVRAACEFLGQEHRTVCYVEREAAAAAQLVALMEAGALHQAPVWSDMLTFDGAAWRGLVDRVIAGFPCQDLSIAGKRAGLDGKRSGLFFRVLDIADDCGACELVLENVAGIASATATVMDEAEGYLEERAASRVLGELADRGWNAEWITISASDVGASHGRARWFCFAWRTLADAGRLQRHQRYEQDRPGGPEKSGHQANDRPTHRGGLLDDSKRIERPGQRVHPRSRPDRSGAPHTIRPSDTLADTDAPGQRTGWRERCDQPRNKGGDAALIDGPLANPGQPRLPHPEQPGEPESYGRGTATELCGTPLFAPSPFDPRWSGIITNQPYLAPATEPGVRMLANGVAYLVDESRTHQLRQVGNGVVPLQAAVAFVQLLRRAGI